MSQEVGFRLLFQLLFFSWIPFFSFSPPESVPFLFEQNARHSLTLHVSPFEPTCLPRVGSFYAPVVVAFCNRFLKFRVAI